MNPTDYIMKIIQQFVQALASIMRARQAGDKKEARTQIRTAGRFYLKSDMAFLLACTPAQIVQHFEGDAEKLAMAADLFHEEALICEKEEESQRLKISALHLYLAAILKDRQFQEPAYFDKADALLAALQNVSLPKATEKQLSLYRQLRKN